MHLIFQQLGVALALGLLVGLQREYAEKRIAGLRTFPLVTVLGTLVAIIDREAAAGGWIIAAGLLAVVALVVVANVFIMRQEEPDLGLTTEFAILVMFVVGAFLAGGQFIIAVAVGAGVAVLLQFKVELHGIVERLGDADLRAIMQFVLFTGIILPILPGEPVAQEQTIALGTWQLTLPLDVLVPREIWLMVVLIVGISLGGYLLYKFFGRRAGILLGGILGGSISSTATTVSYSNRTSATPALSRMASVVIMIASSVVFARVLVEIAVVAPDHLAPLGLPVLIVLLASALTALLAWLLLPRGGEESMPEQRNPTEFKSALVFAAMYAAVLFALALVKRSHFIDESGLYAVAALSGLTDMDAITLSTSRLVRDSGISEQDGWRLILIAAVSNLVFKTGVVAALANRQLLWRIAAMFAVPAVVSGLLIWLWPY